MPALMRRLNYRHIILGRDTENETVAVRTRDWDYRYLPWLGFVDLDRAQSIAGAKPVKLQVMSFAAGDGVGDWIRLRNGEHVQGCLLPTGVYGVLDGGIPRVLKQS